MGCVLCGINIFVFLWSLFTIYNGTYAPEVECSKIIVNKFVWSEIEVGNA